MINFPDSPIIGQQFTVGGTTWTWDGTVWTATGNILGISDAPTDGQIYARSNASWVLSSGGGGGGISDAPSDGTLYARKNNTWMHVAHTDITDWTATLAPYALTSSLPAASTSTPLMDGIAAVGTGTTWARADHVHPHDTTLYSASNPAGYIPDAPNDTNTYARQGAAWVALPTLGVTISATPPASPSAGQLWWDSVGGQLYVWYNDGTSTQWVIANNSVGGSGASIFVGDTPPASPTIGALWFDSVGQQLYVWYNDGNTTQWVPTTNQLGGGYLQKAGVTDGSNAPTGQIGEYLEVSAPPVALTSNVVKNIASLSLTAGDWDVEGVVSFNASGTWSIAQGYVSGTATGYDGINLGYFVITMVAASSGQYTSIPTGSRRFSLAAPAVVYVNASMQIVSGTVNASGAIRARRAR